MSTGTDISTLSLTNQLPIRGEKRIVAVPADPTVAAPMSAYERDAALQQGYQAVLVKIPGRIPGRGASDSTQAAYFKFLINPSQVQVNKQTIDAQALAKGGWQIGVWGEDFTTISLQGKTPGKYFANGVTDKFTEFTESYRNLLALELVVENNGYYFEGEQMNEGPLAADFLRRRIHMHQDVELTVGEFVWSGMFETMTVVQDADTPFLAQFSLTFVAWKERFRSGTPYTTSTSSQSNVQRGASPSAVPTNALTVAAITDAIAMMGPTLDASLQAALNPLPSNVSSASAAISSNTSSVPYVGSAGDVSVVSDMLYPYQGTMAQPI